ncbi:class I SAM-dependent methyltransferase [Niabella ginsengisoli]|uniref:Class I SAM-dependent methyltransferase n=1 Tax=Niabella ginsengisoli TaxID=522298 RepID=A0ABS9SEQ1_9BACT|nr:class I SAM-dependent methyltransferase [Niabella ginsengisoli]MCH5596836.1 class I SAM-dependent methyltransferase [Niabella ginsengisoli]
MKCRICSNDINNKQLVLKEMMYGLKDLFDYFQCSNCGCIQISEIPANIDKYYPNDYYSYTAAEVPVKRSAIRSLHFNYHAFNKNKMIGGLLALKFKPSLFYDWLKVLNLHNRNERVLDIGCGNGQLLKRMYRLGFNDLTGIDPFLNQDTIYNEHLRLLKKDVFEMEGRYDVIMMHHSLEHMDHQHEVIAKAASLLNNNGRLLIRIPIVSTPLLEKYGVNVATLDPPRHFFVHSLQSIKILTKENNLSLYKTVFDAQVFSILASEQYTKGISNVNDSRSYIQNPEGSSFTEEDLARFQQEINDYNQRGESDSVALYFKKEY